MSWLPMELAPRDGTVIRIKWRNAEDLGEWSVFRDPEELWGRFPEYTGIFGEWSTLHGNAEADEIEPLGWKPLPTGETK